MGLCPNILKYKPEFMIHGDDWLEGPLAPFRDRALEALSSYGGKLIKFLIQEIFQKPPSQEQIVRNIPEIRQSSLKRLKSKKYIANFRSS